MVDIIWPAITAFGDLRLWILIIIVAGYYVHFINKNSKSSHKIKIAINAVCIALFFSIFFVAVLKAEINVPRECIPCLSDGSNITFCNAHCPNESRFPSGHATIAFAVLGSLWVTMTDRKKLLIYALPVFAIASLIAISRVALGVHEPIDILMGALIGILITCIAHLLNRHYKIVRTSFHGKDLH